MYIVYIRERYQFSLVRTLRKAIIKNFKAKVDVQKGAPRFYFFVIDVLASSKSHFHPLLSYGNSPQ